MNEQPNRVNLTAGRIEAFGCPKGKSQAFLWDTDTPTLAVRVTPTGRKTYIFESRLNGATLRITIGTTCDWPIREARMEAQRLKMMVDRGNDPRLVKKAQQSAVLAEQSAEAARQETEKLSTLTVGEVWADYLNQRKPRWGERTYIDHVEKAAPAGIAGRRGRPSVGGPLCPLMPLKLSELSASELELWAEQEGKQRPASARLSLRLLKAFINWCSEHPTYAQLVSSKNPTTTKKIREALGKPGVAKDAWQKAHLPDWFDAVQKIHIPAVSACLQIILLTGARPGEVRRIKWQDVNIQWKGIVIRDKVEGTREIPATPYILHLISSLPRRNEYVFAGLRAAVIANPKELHDRACKVAGIEGLTLNGLRRSFKSLTEWIAVPIGIRGQLMGHKPSATAEKHYTTRPLDLLRLHHEAIEKWILEQAGVPIPESTQRLTVVSA